MDFDTQRQVLLAEVSGKLDAALTGLNEINRAIEEVVAVGKDMENVAGLWATIDEIARHNRHERA